MKSNTKTSRVCWCLRNHLAADNVWHFSGPFAKFFYCFAIFFSVLSLSLPHALAQFLFFTTRIVDSSLSLLLLFFLLLYGFGCCCVFFFLTGPFVLFTFMWLLWLCVCVIFVRSYKFIVLARLRLNSLSCFFRPCSFNSIFSTAQQFPILTFFRFVFFFQKEKKGRFFVIRVCMCVKSILFFIDALCACSFRLSRCRIDLDPIIFEQTQLVLCVCVCVFVCVRAFAVCVKVREREFLG